VEGSANTWTISDKSSQTSEAEDVIGWAGVQPRREGAWRMFKPPGRREKEDVFFILYSPQVGSFKGGMSLTLVTFFFETSKLWANILTLS